MNILSCYDSDSDSENEQNLDKKSISSPETTSFNPKNKLSDPITKKTMSTFDLAPDDSDFDSDSDSDEEDEKNKVIVVDSAHKKGAVACTSGSAQQIYYDDILFKKNYNSFENYGVYLNHSLPNTAISGPITEKNIYQVAPRQETLEIDLANTQNTKNHKKRLFSTKDAGSDDFTGSWGKFAGEDEMRMPAGPKEDHLDAKKLKSATESEKEVVTFYGESKFDSLGRSFLTPPSHFRSSAIVDCTIPKKRFHTWSGHSKGVSNVEFFPTGHLMMSASMDGSVKLWSTEGSHRCMQSYIGHSEAVRQVKFNSDGKQFVTTSFDKKVKVWDTETGSVLYTVNDGKSPLCSAFETMEGNQLVIGSNHRYITQWDIRSNTLSQEYDVHRSAVNTVTFINDGKQFISTGDDKNVLVFDLSVPVPIKQISEVDLHTIASVALHPSGNYMVANAMDNQALVFAINGDRVKLNKRKRFTGHLTSGFNCGLTFSPDGKFLVSGDASGHIFIWDFKKGHLKKKIKAHNEVCVDVKWHPYDESRLISCSWDTSIKYWK